MKRLLIVLLMVIVAVAGCSLIKYSPGDMPVSNNMKAAAPVPVVKKAADKIPLPPAVEKPAIKSEVIDYKGKIYVGYSVPDAMKLYEYIIKQDARMDKLEYRIKVMD